MSKPPADKDISPRPPKSDGDWLEYRRFILDQLTSINSNQRITDVKVDEIRLYIASQKGWVAAMAGAVSVVSSIVVLGFQWVFKKE